MEFLSDAWLEAMDAAVRSDPTLQATSQGAHLVLQQRVTDTPSGDVSWHVTVDDGTVAVTPGDADAPDVTFSQDYATAIAVGTGEQSAQGAFMLGRLRIGGSVGRLIEQRALFDGLDDLFVELRAATTYPDLDADTDA